MLASSSERPTTFLMAARPPTVATRLLNLPSRVSAAEEPPRMELFSSFWASSAFRICSSVRVKSDMTPESSARACRMLETSMAPLEAVFSASKLSITTFIARCMVRSGPETPS